MFPNILALLAAGPPPEMPALITDPVVGAPEDLLGVENNPKPVDLVVSPPNRFPPLEPPLPKCCAGLLVLVLAPKSDVEGADVAGVLPKLFEDGFAEDALLCPKTLLLCPAGVAVLEPNKLLGELLSVEPVPNRSPAPAPPLVERLLNENGRPDELGGPDMVRESCYSNED